MRLGGLVNYHGLLGCDRDTFIATGAESWATYANEKGDAHIEFSLRQAIMYCTNLDLQLPDLSDDARLHAPLYDACKESGPPSKERTRTITYPPFRPTS